MSPALELTRVGVRIEGREILAEVDWSVARGEHWVVLGPNGAGKTTLARIASLQLHPSSGRVVVLGGVLGRIDVRRHRAAVGITSAAIAAALRPELTAHDAVVTALRGALEPWWHTYTDEDHARARAQLARLGVGHLADHTVGTLSSGERQRVLLARALVADPGLLLLDEPAAGLDLGGREALLTQLSELSSDPDMPPTILVTHHLEEIPAATSHALLLRDGRILASGPIDEVLREDLLSDCFGLALHVRRDRGRWSARAATS